MGDRLWPGVVFRSFPRFAADEPGLILRSLDNSLITNTDNCPGFSRSPLMSNSATDDNDDTTSVIAIFPTVNGNFAYFVEADRHNALQSFIAENHENQATYPANLM